MRRMFVVSVISFALLFSAAFAQFAQERVSRFEKTVSFSEQAMSKKSLPQGKQKTERLSVKSITACKSDNPDKALVKLVVGSNYNDGSGYQILFDKDATLSDNLQMDYGALVVDKVAAYYAASEFTLPENARPEENMVLENSSAEAYIDGGVYDVVVLNPTFDSYFGKIMHYVVGNDFILNDFLFEAGYAYLFEVEVIKDVVYYDLYVPFDIAAGSILLPAGCEAEPEMEVRMKVGNIGTSDIEGYTVWYNVAGSGDTVKETVTGKLEAGKDTEYVFATKVAVEEDAFWILNAGILPLEQENEVTVRNNTRQRGVKKSAAVDVPYDFDIAAHDFIPQDMDAWLIDGPAAYCTMEPDEPLVSRCVNLQGGKTYRLTYEYQAGLVYFFEWYESYHVAYGLVSDPVSKWKTIYSENEVLVEDWSTMDATFKVEKDGEYAFLFQVDDVGNFFLRNVRITEVVDHDVRLCGFNTGMPRLVPEEHANGMFAASVTVQNRGKMQIDRADVNIAMNGVKLTETQLTAIAPEAFRTADLSLNLNGLKRNETVVFSAAVSLENEAEAQRDDNTQTQSVEVSDTVMAYDYVKEDMYDRAHAIGAPYRLGCGIPFYLAVKDTLTAISVGWSEVEKDLPIEITVHAWNGAVLGDLIYETTCNRGIGAGQCEYAVPALILDEGHYMISVIQTGSVSFDLITDDTKEGGFYITTETPVEYQQGLGTPCIRAVFGHNGKPLTKDIAVLSITKPAETGVFAVNQEVCVEVANLGYENAQAPVVLMVNDVPVDTQSVEVAAYGRQQLCFTADLSAYDTRYNLTVFSILEADMNRANDTCRKTIKSLPAPNPYVMDWEYCEDFSIDNFVPAWKTVDVDAAPTYIIGGLSFPHMYEPYAFMAFNPDVLNLAVEAHGGKRFGASFSSDVVNDHWLISPKLKILENQAEMRFFVKSYTERYGLDEYNVWVSTTDDKLNSFTQIRETRRAAAADWEEVVVGLDEYAGMEVHLAIRCVSDKTLMFMIDDITVCGQVRNEKPVRLDTRLSLYPNPAREMIRIHAQDAVIHQVEVFNVSGMRVYCSNRIDGSDFNYSVGALCSGLYFARVSTDQGTAVLKFTVR